MDLLKQIRIAVVGIPDCGKSTFIKEVVKLITNKELSPDTLMNEIQYSKGKDIYGNNDTRTIKAAKVFFKYKDLEFCFYDCPGHLEYLEEIKQGLESASVIIKILDNNRINQSLNYLSKDIFITNKIEFVLKSHSNITDDDNYNILDNQKGFNNLIYSLLDKIYNFAKLDIIPTINIEKEAKSLIKDTLSRFNNIGMFFSGGKDSLVGLELLKQCNYLNKVKILFPNSGYDFKEVLNSINLYKDLYSINIQYFDNTCGKSLDDISIFEWMKNKAISNNNIIANKKLDLVLIQYRASDEGVRSKDYHLVKRNNHYRFSPVFYFSETNIWRFISKYKLTVCSLYFNGYRSLGDNFCTEPCIPYCNDVEEIINYIDNNPNTLERAGRIKQDFSNNFTMEKLRNVGFF